MKMVTTKGASKVRIAVAYLLFGASSLLAQEAATENLHPTPAPVAETEQEKAPKTEEEPKAKEEPKTEELAGDKEGEDPNVKEREKLAAENALLTEKANREVVDLRNKLMKIKLEKDLLLEEIALAAAKRKKEQDEKESKFLEKRKELNHQVALTKAKLDLATNNFKIQEFEWTKETKKIKAELAERAARETQHNYAQTEPVYIKNPLKEDGTLVISDRRIDLNGPIVYKLAQDVIERIHYYNNKNSEQPIFILIDGSPGGSVMAGELILKAMESSKAPIHVIVKGYAASMAAVIATNAETSYAYPNAIVLHHQISSWSVGNLTQQREGLAEMEEWWRRFATPIAKKMGITIEELITQMYENRSTGDWSEFGDKAAKLKWVDHIVYHIEETWQLENPDKVENKKKPSAHFNLVEELDEKGKPVVYLPRLWPRDIYFLYNPDDYYRLR